MVRRKPSHGREPADGIGGTVAYGLAAIPIPPELNQYFQPAPVTGSFGLIRRWQGVYTAPPGVFDLNARTFTPNVMRVGPHSYEPMGFGNQLMASGHRGLMDYGIDGLLYAIPSTAIGMAYRQQQTDRGIGNLSAPPVNFPHRNIHNEPGGRTTYETGQR
jgi:hypothetical protein